MYCSKCGREINEENNFCPWCGNGTHQVCVVNEINEDKIIIWILFICLGGYGVHRLYLGGEHTKWGIVYMLTGAFCLFGWFYDLFHLSQWIEEYKLEKSRCIN